jgi:TonB family protein
VILCGLAEEYGRGRTLDALSAEKPPAATQETKTLLDEKRKGSAARYAEAAANLQKFIELSSSNEDLSLWKEQLETLKAYSNTDRDPGSPRTVFYHNEVTTKVRVLEKPEPAYTARAKETGVVGTVVLRAIFSADGTVKHILVLSGVPYGLTQQAVSAAKRIRFEPATLNGNKVSTFMQLEYNFNLY